MADTVQVERAAQWPEELAFLQRIVDCPADDTERLVYADWLDDRGDARATLLRECLEAFREERELPALDGVPPGWADITGLTILHKIAEANLREWRDEILGLARPALHLVVEEVSFDNPLPAPAAMGTTRLGGDPDLPAGVSYPTAADGVPLYFISQFDLADLQGTIAARFFPPAGLLSIFRTESDGKNCYPEKADLPRLVQLTPPGTKLKRIERRVLGPENDPLAPFRPDLRLVETLRLPASMNQWPGVKLTYELESQLDRVFPTNLGGTKYILLGHVTHGNIGEEPIKDRGDWVQLVLVPYFEGPDFGISDMSLSYHLPAADLRAGRFNRLEATFG